MICDKCGKPIAGVYIGDTSTGKVFCRNCVLNRRNKYDHDEIFRMHINGASYETIARRMGTNVLTVSLIIRRMERNAGMR